MAAPSKKPIGKPALTTTLAPADMLKAMRDLLGLSQEAFAAKVGMKRQQISAYETGQYSPGIDTLADIAAKAGVRVEVVIHAPKVAGAAPAAD